MEGCSLSHSSVLLVLIAFSWPALRHGLRSDFGGYLAVELLQQHRLAERRVIVHVRGAIFHIVHPGVAALPDSHGDGMLITRDAQQSHQIALMVQHCMRAVFSGRYKGAEQHLLPHAYIKEFYG